MPILLASQTLQKHLVHLQKVAQRLRNIDSGLQLKPSKCMFATGRIEHLGHMLGVKPNEHNVQAVAGFP